MGYYLFTEGEETEEVLNLRQKYKKIKKQISQFD